MENPSLDKLIIFDDWIMCEPLKEERDFGQGLVSPTTHEEKTYKAIVRKIGDGVKKPIKLGDIVHFNAYASITLPYGDINYLMLKDEDILGAEIGAEKRNE